MTDVDTLEFVNNEEDVVDSDRKDQEGDNLSDDQSRLDTDSSDFFIQRSFLFLQLVGVLLGLHLCTNFLLKGVDLLLELLYRE